MCWYDDIWNIRNHNSCGHYILYFGGINICYEYLQKQKVIVLIALENVFIETYLTVSIFQQERLIE